MKVKELEEREAMVKKNEERVDVALKKLKQKEETMNVMERKMEQQKKELEENKKALEEVVGKRMALNVAKVVGGQVYPTPSPTLQGGIGSFYDLMEPPRDDRSRYFFDRGLNYYQKVLNCQDGDWKVHESDTGDGPHISQAPNFENVQEQEILIGGDLLCVEQQKKVREWIPQKKFNLIYRATRDGFGAEAFHAKCDEYQGTLTVIKSKEGHLFGGFTSQSWEGTWYKEDPAAFLFTFTNPHHIPPTKYSINDASLAVFCHPSYCPTFGRGHDVRVSSSSNQDGYSSTSFPSSFIDSTGKGKATFAGAQNFSTVEIEVYSVLEF